MHNCRCIGKTMKGLCIYFQMKMHLCAIMSNFIKIALITRGCAILKIHATTTDASSYNSGEFVSVLERKRDAAASRYSGSTARSAASYRRVIVFGCKSAQSRLIYNPVDSRRSMYRCVVPIISFRVCERRRIIACFARGRIASRD